MGRNNGAIGIWHSDGVKMVMVHICMVRGSMECPKDGMTHRSKVYSASLQIQNNPMHHLTCSWPECKKSTIITFTHIRLHTLLECSTILQSGREESSLKTHLGRGRRSTEDSPKIDSVDSVEFFAMCNKVWSFLWSEDPRSSVGCLSESRVLIYRGFS